MPELPEVQTVVNQLKTPLSNKVVQNIRIFDSKLRGPSYRTLSDKHVNLVTRIGKQIVIGFADRKSERYLAIHLRMSGRLCWKNRNESIESKHLRAKITFDDGSLVFHDPRRFGTFTLAKSIDELAPVGVEPLNRDFTVSILRELLTPSSQAIKPWLLRQDKIVGLGNIYASEILFRAQIHPERELRSLTSAEIKALHRSIGVILNQAIRNCGTTFSDFQDAHGASGSFQKFLKVYDRDGGKCRRCKAKILRIVQLQRSTYFCESCQR